MIKKIACALARRLCAHTVVFVAERCLVDDFKEVVGVFHTLEAAQKACEPGDEHTVSSYGVDSTEGTLIATMNWEGAWELK